MNIDSNLNGLLKSGILVGFEKYILHIIESIYNINIFVEQMETNFK